MKKFFLSNEEIINHIENGKPVILKDYKLDKETEDFFIECLGVYLKYLGKEKIFDHLSYCLRELLNNAKKANTKRVFFLDEKLDINNPQDYEKGMKLFKSKTISNIDYYLDLQEKNNLYIQLYYNIKDPFFNIIISNNSPILPQEREKILSKISHAKTFNSIEDAFQNVLDDSEGAGLGIVIMILLLRKIGVLDKNFAIVQENGVTHVKISIPLSLVTEEEAEQLSEVLVKEIDSVPQFPDHITKLTKLIENKDVDFKEILELIRTDPGLTVEILKMSNSAHYRRGNKIEKIEIALSIIGVKGLRFLLQSYGVKVVMETKYKKEELEKIWAHSYKVALISSILCDILNVVSLGEHAYTGGLLHDIGKIVLMSLHKNTIEKINKFCINKNISIGVIETLMDGANHFQIGAKMAVKWKLPQLLIDIINGQSNPYAVSDENKAVTKIVYLANILANKMETENPEYLNYETMILNDFKIDNEEKLKNLLDKVKERLNIYNNFY